MRRMFVLVAAALMATSILSAVALADHPDPDGIYESVNEIGGDEWIRFGPHVVAYVFTGFSVRRTEFNSAQWYSSAHDDCNGGPAQTSRMNIFRQIFGGMWEAGSDDSLHVKLWPECIGRRIRLRPIELWMSYNAQDDLVDQDGQVWTHYLTHRQPLSPPVSGDVLPTAGV